MIYVIGPKGDFKPANKRVPDRRHWNIYQRARREAPDLCQAMYDTISEMVESGRYFDSGKREFPNSTWLGKQILSTWQHKDRWDAYCGNQETSSALFGQIMWTRIWDDSRQWCTTITANANEGREERVYFLSEKKPNTYLEDF